MTFYQDAMIHANGIQIHFYRSTPPAGGPSLLFCHGLTGNGLSWLRVANALRGQYDLVMPDARGHGLSEKPLNGYTYEDRAADVAGLIDALSLDRPVVIGHSMGGETAMAAAALYPDKVSGAVLEDPAWFNAYGESNTEGENETTRGWREDLQRHQRMGREALIEEFRRDHPHKSAEELAASADARLQMGVNALVKILGSLKAGWREHVRTAVCPILLITGDPKLGAIITPEMVRECESLWKEGQEAHIPGVGHSIREEKFDLYMQKLCAFLNNLK